MPKVKIIEENTLLDDAKGVGRYALDTLGDTATGVQEGAIGLLGLLPSISNMISPRSDYERMMGGSLTPDVLRRALYDRDTTPANLAQTGKPEPYQTGVGKLLGAVGEQVAPTMLPVSRMGKAVEAANYLKSAAVPTVSTGAGVAGAREAYPGDPTAELVGGLLAGFGPDAAMAATRGLLRPRNVEDMRTNISRMEAENITPTMGSATEKDSVQSMEGLLRITPGTRTKMFEADERFIEEISDSIRSKVQTLAPKSQTEDAGRVIQAGIQEFLDSFRTRSSEMFDAINIADNAMSPATNTSRYFKLSTTPTEGAETLSTALTPTQLQTLAGAFAQDLAEGGQIPFSALKALRTSVGEKIATNNLLDDMSTGQYKALYSSITKDMEELARNTDAKTEALLTGRGQVANEARPNALPQFKRANRFYNAGAKRIENVLNSVLRSDPPSEQIYDRVKQGINRGGTKVRAIRRSMSPERWKAYQASFLEELSSAPPGQQSIDFEVFSPDRFATNYNKLSERGRKAMFGGQAGLEDELDNLARIIERNKAAKQKLANPSRTAESFAMLGLLGAPTALYVGGVLDPGAIFTLAGTIFGAQRIGSAMTNPKFVKWVAESGKIKPEQVAGHAARLAAIFANADDRSQADAEALATAIVIQE
jgi:hypothetical protein